MAMTGNERTRKLRAAKFGQPVPEGTKHGQYVRRVYGCKCWTCGEAIRKKLKAQRERARGLQAEKPTWGRWREVNKGLTTLCWPPAGAGPDWVCPHEVPSDQRSETQRDDPAKRRKGA